MGSGKFGAAGDLVGALPADSAETDADLVGADEMEPGVSHGSPSACGNLYGVIAARP